MLFSIVLISVLVGFNSIKVRLRPFMETKQSPTHFSFNSIKVRLRLGSSFDSSCNTPFQFHKGSIKTNVINHGIQPLLSFNSIKVRLRLVTTAVPFFLILFQFHKGSIKTLLLITIVAFLIRFNSIKVRLRQSS